MYYGCYLSTEVNAENLEQRDSGLLALESDDYTKEEIKAIKVKGYKVLAYLSIGTLERERPWYKDFSKYKLDQLGDWPNEYYMDMKKTVWQKFLVQRATDMKVKGFDGWWCDNLDVYSEYKSTAEFTACLGILQKIKKVGGYVMVNGGSEFLDDAFDRSIKSSCINGYTQEEVFSRITDYSGKGKFGKQKSEDRKYYQRMLKNAYALGIQTFLLEYTRDDDVKKSIKDFCKKNNMTGYHISEDVNL
jgi:endo-alpha-1,4-polygalactosaminidase (GH114 family)